MSSLAVRDSLVRSIADAEITMKMAAAFGAITGRIREIDTVGTSIAAAVEQPSTGTAEATRNIVGVARASEDTGAAAPQVPSAFGELSRQSGHLTAEVARFLGNVRAA